MRRFNSIKKSRKKSKDIDEKIEYLNKECQKTGINEIANSTTGLYQGSSTNPNEKYVEFTAKNCNGYPFGISGDSNLGQQSVGGAMIRADGVAMSPPHPITGERTRAFTKGGLLQSMKPAIPGDGDRSQGDRMTGPILWWFDPTYTFAGAQGRWVSMEYNSPAVHGNGVYPGFRAGWGYWGSNFIGTPMLRDDESYQHVFDCLNDSNGDQFNPDDITIPTTTVFFQNDLGDPTHLPIDVRRFGLSPEAFDKLRDEAKLAMFGFGSKPPKPIYYGGPEAEFRRQLQKDLELMQKLSPVEGGPGGVIKLSHVPEGDLLSEGIKLGHFEPEVLNVDINDIRKGIMPEFPKDPPEMINGYSSKSRLAPKIIKGEPFIKITKKDLARNHKLTDKEISDFMNDIKMVNDYIKKNPAQLIYVMTRYPKDDPRLAQLNFKMDQMKAASDQYMETHFPENKSLFDKLQQKISSSIGQTDPKNFKDHTPPPKFTDDLDTIKRRKKTVSRHFKKIKRKRG